MGKFTAIVLSGGSGSRMKSDVPKQYLNLKGKPVLYYSLKAFEESGVDDIVLVAAKEYLEYCRTEIIDRYGLTKVKTIVTGGSERYFSVYEGLRQAQASEYVLIHDGARPFVNEDIIARSMKTVATEQACVVGMPVKDTIRIVDANGYSAYTPERNLVWQIQTPQTFSYPLITQAYQELMRRIDMGADVPTITDDAMVLEYIYGKKVRLIEGDYRNIKITTPEDLQMAEQFA